tara:strand:+ start:1383 stop:2315 length:933 start_codon:yes stop_codon:yes gene_type:complete
MDLIEYLSGFKKGKKLRKKISRGRNKIPRRGRGFGQRSSKYNSSANQSFRDNMDKQLLALLTTLTKQNQTTIDLSNPKALNPFIEKDKQTYSMKFDSNKNDLYTMDEKQGIRKAIDLPKTNPVKIKETKNLIFNVSQDIDSRVEEVLEDQKELLTKLETITVMSPEAAKDFRDQNIRLKEQVLSETTRIQGMLNEAEDLNDYRGLIEKQNNMIDKTIRGFANIDNDLSKRQVGEQEELQKAQVVMGRELGNLIEKVGGRQEEIEGLKLTLERNELREQVLKQELAEMESIVDKQHKEMFAMEREGDRPRY